MGIGKAIELPYRALINTVSLIGIPFLINKWCLLIGYCIFYVKLIFVATLVSYFGSVFTIISLCLIFVGFV